MCYLQEEECTSDSEPEQKRKNPAPEQKEKAATMERGCLMVYIPSELPTFWGSGDLKSFQQQKRVEAEDFFFCQFFPSPFLNLG